MKMPLDSWQWRFAYPSCQKYNFQRHDSQPLEREISDQIDLPTSPQSQTSQSLESASENISSRSERISAVPNVVTLTYYSAGKLLRRKQTPPTTPHRMPALGPLPNSEEDLSQYEENVRKALVERRRQLICLRSIGMEKALPGQFGNTTALSRLVGHKTPQSQDRPFQERLEHSHATTSTPTGPYSSTDLISAYNNDGSNQYLPDDHHISNGTEIERRKSQDREPRPLSRKESKRSIVQTSREKGGSDRESEWAVRLRGDTSGSTGGSPTRKNNYFRPLHARNSFLRTSASPPAPRSLFGNLLVTEDVLTRTPLTARESEDTLVAMGTNWNPSQTLQRSGRPGSYSNGTANTNGGGYHLAHQLSISHAPTSMGPRHLGKRNTMPHLSASRPNLRDEPRYPDPASGAPPTFQQRISEMGALESETIRWERNRKFQKKKPRSET